MKKNKNIVKLLAACSLLSISSVMHASLNSSLRRTAGPALQSGVAYYSGVSSLPIMSASHISAPKNYAQQNFKPASYQHYAYPSKNIGSQAQSSMIHPFVDNGSDGSRFSSNDVSASAKFFLSVLASLGLLSSQKSYADEEQERAVNVGELVNPRKVDAALYPELTKFIKKYSCDKDLDARAQSIMGAKNYMDTMDTLEKQRHADYNLDNAYFDSNIENAKMHSINPILSKGGFFNAQSLGGKGGFIPTSGDLFNDAASVFFIKGPSIDRIVNAERMNKYLKDNKLHRFAVARECLTCKDGSVNVVSEKIKLGDQSQKISLQEVQDLVKISEDTGYWDWQFGRNVMRDADGRFVFVDTEDISYDPTSGYDSKKAMIQGGLSTNFIVVSKGDKPNRIVRMLSSTHTMKPEAQEWLLAKINGYGFEQLQKKQLALFTDEQQKLMLESNLVLSEEQQKNMMKVMMDFMKSIALREGLLIPLSENSHYDTDIDFEQVKREFKDFQDSQSTIEEID